MKSQARRNALNAGLAAANLDLKKKTNGAQKTGSITLKSLESYLRPPFAKDLAWAIGQVKKARGVDSAAGAVEPVAAGVVGAGGGAEEPVVDAVAEPIEPAAPTEPVGAGVGGATEPVVAGVAPTIEPIQRSLSNNHTPVQGEQTAGHRDFDLTHTGIAD